MLTNFVEYVIQHWFDRPDKSTPLSAQRLNHIEEGIKANSDALAEIRSSFLDVVYPVGSIYMSTNEADPADVLGGGTWEHIKDRFLLAAGDTYTAGSTGGEAAHTLSTAEMPEHSHLLAKGESSSNTGRTFSQYSAYQAEAGITEGQYWWSTTTTNGNSQAHNNMPPYLTVYVWKRTA